MVRIDEAGMYSPPVSPIRRAMSMLTSRGQFSLGMPDILLNGSALDTEEDESSAPQLLVIPPPPSRQRSSSGSSGASPGLGLASLGRKAVSLVRSKSSSWSGVLKRQEQSHKRSHSETTVTLAAASPRAGTTQSPRRVPSPSPRSPSPVSMHSLTDEHRVSLVQDASPAVPDLLQRGTPMIKVSGRKQKNVVCKLDPDQGQIIWESKKHRISTSFIVILR
jgi:hypothetical protein